MLAAAMQAAEHRQFDPAGAGVLLATGLAAAIGVGAVVGWALGSIGYGILVGAIVGIPLGVYTVWRRYRGAF